MSSFTHAAAKCMKWKSFPTALWQGMSLGGRSHGEGGCGGGVRPVVLCGPSGSGKSTLLRRLMEEYKDIFGFSISHTTRKPRKNEKDGIDYHFVECEKMEKMKENMEFIETAVFSDNMYGTSKKAVEDVIHSKRICILDIDMQGVKSIKNTDLKPLYLFIKPPSLEALRQRLQGRNTESLEMIEKRLAVAKEELEYCKEDGAFDHIILNDQFDIAYEKLRAALIKDINNLKMSRREKTGDQ